MARNLLRRDNCERFRGLNASSLETFAGTATRWGQRLVVSAAVQCGWPLFTWDISTAFLQGASFEELAKLTGQPVRQVSFKPPAGSEDLMAECPGIKQGLQTHV
jgi:hypothetical protein